jgi:probable rRNA maturation factor
MPTTRIRRKIDVQYAVPRRGVPPAALLRKWARSAAPRTDLTLRVVGAAEGRMLNNRFRKKNRPTNVLSFQSGDIVLCHPVVAREARAQRKSVAAHYAHLVIHGVLHLRGFPHGKRMEAREIRALARLGFADPYTVE